MFLKEGIIFLFFFFEVENILKCGYAPGYKVQATIMFTLQETTDEMVQSSSLSRGPQRYFEDTNRMSIFAKKENNFFFSHLNFPLLERHIFLN